MLRRTAITTEIPKQIGERTVCDCDLVSSSFSWSCTVKVHTVTKSESQHFVVAKHTMKTDQDIKLNVQTSLYPCQICNTTDHRWRDRRCTPRHLVTSSGFQLFPSVCNSSMQLWVEMMQGSQSVFSLSKTISSCRQFFLVLWKFIIQASNCAGHWYAKIVQITKEIFQRLLITSASCLCPSLYFGSRHSDDLSAGLTLDVT